MDHTVQNSIVSFIWNIADDVLRDVYVRGKYRDVILPMTVIRRLDALLEPTKDDVLKMKAQLDKAKIVNQEAALRKAAGQSFYNTSNFTLRGLMANPKQLRANFTAYLDGFSANVAEIVEKFDFRNQLRKLEQADVLGHLIEKFLNPDVNLSPQPVLDGAGNVRLPGLSNLGMGYVFEELIRRFNEENNEEAGEHFTPREIVHLMASLLFLPIQDEVTSGTYTVYDCTCGTGGMLTETETMLNELAAAHKKDVSIHLYGQESQPETYAICKADLLIKGEEEGNIAYGSTLSADSFPRLQFNFMLANPPYGKSWKTDLDRLCGGDKKEMRDYRFVVNHNGNAEFKLIPRSSDGQLLFLVNMLSKMKHDTPLGSRVATVHNGSSLFTGDAGQGESNIRQWILENDWLEAIIALPLNLFYNTGIATYIWVLSNRKPKQRRGKVQLIDATKWFSPRRKNLGKKNCDLSPEDVQRICDTFLAFEESEQSKIFPNEAFGYWKVTVERPLRLRSQMTKKAIEGLRFASGDEALRRELYDRFSTDLYEAFGKVKPDLEKHLDGDADSEDEESDGEDDTPKRPKLSEKRKKKLLDPATWLRDHKLVNAAKTAQEQVGDGLFENHNLFREQFDKALADAGLKLSAAEKKIIINAVSWRNEQAPPVVAKVHKPGKAKADTLHGLYEAKVAGKACIVEYEPDSELRDSEQVPLLEEGGIEAYIRREVLPHVPDAWIDESATKVGYEISFTRHFYKPQPLRSLEEIRADILALERETEGLLSEIIGVPV